MTRVFESRVCCCCCCLLVWFGCLFVCLCLYRWYCCDCSAIVLPSCGYLKLLTRQGELVVPGVFVNRKFYILTVAAGRAKVVGSTRQQAVWRSRALILLSFLRLELHSSNSRAHQQPPGAATAADLLCGSGRYNSLLSCFP